MDNTEAVLTGKKLQIARLSWWFIFLSYGLVAIFDQWYDYQKFGAEGFFEGTYAYLVLTIDVLGFSIAAILFWKHSNKWMTIVVSMVIIVIAGVINVESSFYFWYFVFNHGWGNLEIFNNSASIMAFYFSIPYDIFMFTIYSYGILIFPTGRWIFPNIRWLFWVSAIFFAILNVLPSESMGNLSRNITIIFSVIAVISQGVNYYKMETSIQRQQIKWILFFFALIVLDTLISPLFYFYYSRQILFVCFLVAVSFSIVRYRLWDIEIFINRTVVYSALTGLLGLLGIISVTALDYFIKKVSGETSSLWAVLISVLPIAAVFNPLREHLQGWVDHYFKPEEVNFENHFLEFRADIRNMLGTSHIIEIVSKQVKKQLDVNFAHIHLADKSSKITQFALSDDVQKILANGDLVVGEDNGDYSLLVPLVVTRPVIPDFLGVIVLGHRLSGRGYSTPMLESLKLLGANAGEAIYLSQLNEQAKIQVSTSQS